ncbi:hypothetical protein [Aliiroseovarius sp. 2305UL8-7]|uniref:hypothetical protein n=1 Tax=Aliiroseovarius conchicola TaxID=3121637 RepID=UPI003527D991
MLNIVAHDHPLHYPPMGCSKCGGTEFVDVRVESIRDRDYPSEKMRIAKNGVGIMSDNGVE